MAWYQNEDAEDRSARKQLELARRRKHGAALVPLVVPQGSRKLVSTFWGKAWCQHLEKYSDYEYRLPRGRSYLRQGQVYDLSVEPGLLRALVLGSSMYEVEVRVAPLAAGDWSRLQAACAGQVGSLLDLLSGNLGAGVMTVICDRDGGIFPAPKEIKMSCSCPDWADMCKHIAAVMYGVGVMFDSDASLFFRLRQVDPADLLAAGAQELLPSVTGADAALLDEDLSGLFGIDLAPEELSSVSETLQTGEAPATGRKPTLQEHRADPAPRRKSRSGKGKGASS
ncbi:MAG: hypothetical protein EBS01_06730 [Verrucomicrobia bacterium]|nr:hypothetical protein [Verrucomicrobiota bacterium]